jgi:hypothetical protein
MNFQVDPLSEIRAQLILIYCVFHLNSFINFPPFNSILSWGRRAHLTKDKLNIPSISLTMQTGMANTIFCPVLYRQTN